MMKSMTSKMTWLLFVLWSFCGTAFATVAIDISEPATYWNFQCMFQMDIELAVVRAWRSTGEPDINAPLNICNAETVGLVVDVYMFPCYECGNAQQQVRDTVNFLNKSKPGFDVFWFDIEAPELWSSDPANNSLFMQNLIDEGTSQGLFLGIYTSVDAWSAIMGDYDGGAPYPLWYPGYDNTTSFSDFQPFGGWKVPTMKQYTPNASVCGTSVDMNWFPAGTRKDRKSRKSRKSRLG